MTLSVVVRPESGQRGQATWVQNTPGLSATVAHLGRSLAHIRWDRLVSSPVVVSLGGQQSRIWPLRPKPSRDAVCQRCGMPDLGTLVRQCPLLAMAIGTHLVTRLVAGRWHERLLRRSFRARVQPARGQVEGRWRCLWVTAGDRSFRPFGTYAARILDIHDGCQAHG